MDRISIQWNLAKNSNVPTSFNLIQVNVGAVESKGNGYKENLFGLRVIKESKLYLNQHKRRKTNVLFCNVFSAKRGSDRLI